MTQIIGCILWCFLIFFSLLSSNVKSLLAQCSAAGSLGFNIHAFYKCNRVQTKRMKLIIAGLKQKGINMAVNNLMGASVKLPMR